MLHGGAGNPPPELCEDRHQGLRQAAEKAWQILLGGGSALSAVVAAVAELEDHPAFNAGRGSCLNQDGEVEMDASLMEGATLAAGAVGAIKSVRNPILVAQALLERGKHILLVAEGAERWARSLGLLPATQEELRAERHWRRWQEERGTVGAVALDRRGHLAAATSTGGVWNKHPGRVGDSALIGAGTYADNTLGAASATGDGEAIIRTTLAYAAVCRLRDGKDPQEVARSMVRLLKKRGRGEGGLILLDAFGRMGFAHNTPAMDLAYVRGGQQEILVQESRKGLL